MANSNERQSNFYRRPYIIQQGRSQSRKEEGLESRRWVIAVAAEGGEQRPGESEDTLLPGKVEATAK